MQAMTRTAEPLLDQVYCAIADPTRRAILAVLLLAQKLLPARVAIDVPVALAIVALGVLMVIAPASVPGLDPSM